jgi:hypothetical protein
MGKANEHLKNFPIHYAATALFASRTPVLCASDYSKADPTPLLVLQCCNVLLVPSEVSVCHVLHSDGETTKFLQHGQRHVCELRFNSSRQFGPRDTMQSFLNESAVSAET